MSNKSKKPTHTIFQVIGEKDKAHWTKIGAGWANEDGKGINVVFNAYPTVGRVVVREVTTEETSEAGQK